MRGTGRVFQRGRVYWIAYYHRGKEIRESAHTEDERKARKLLRECGSLAAVREADEETLRRVAGRRVARAIRAHFHDGAKNGPA